jgi:AcrR family transcriptional regulator
MSPRESRPIGQEFQTRTLTRGGNRVAPDDEKTAEIRKYLLEAAQHCFERYGLGKTTMEDVAAAANVSRPTLYRYFKNRDGLVLAVLLEALEDFNQQARDLIARQPNFALAVTDALVLAVQVGIENPYVRMALGPESFSLSSRLIGASKSFHDLAGQIWEPLLRRGIESGEARGNLNLKTACRWLVDIEFLMATRVLEGSMELRHVPKLIREYVLPGFLAAPEPADGGKGRRPRRSDGMDRRGLSAAAHPNS